MKIHIKKPLIERVKKEIDKCNRNNQQIDFIEINKEESIELYRDTLLDNDKTLYYASNRFSVLMNNKEKIELFQRSLKEENSNSLFGYRIKLIDDE